MIGKLLTTISKNVLSKVGILSENAIKEITADAVEKTVKLRNVWDFILGRTFSPEISEKFPLLNIFYRNFAGLAFDNSYNDLISYTQTRLKNFINNREYSKEIFNNTVRLMDAIVSKSLRLSHPVEGDIKELSNRLIKNLDFIDEYGKDLIYAFKEMSDEAGNVLSKKLYGFEDVRETEIIKKLQQMGTYEDVKKIIDILNKRFGERGEWKIWNLYYPHISSELFADRITEESLNVLSPRVAKMFKPFFAYKRTGGTYKHIDDPVLLLQVLKFNTSLWDRLITANDEVLRAYDIFNVFKRYYGEKITRKEIEKFLTNPEVEVSGFERPIHISHLPEEVAKYVKDEFGTEYVQLWDANRLLRAKFSDREVSRMIDLVSDLLPPESPAVMRQRYYLLPSNLADVLKQIHNEVFYAKDIPFWKPLKPAILFWKKLVTIRYPLRFMINNAIGDVLGGTMVFHPEAASEMSNALRFIKDLVNDRLLPLEEYGINVPELAKKFGMGEKEFADFFIKKVKESSIFSGMMREIADAYTIREGASLKNIINSLAEFKFGLFWDNFWKYIFYLNNVREATPRVASVLENLRRIERGEPLHLKGAAEYIRKIAKDKNLWLDAIIDYGNYIHVDYSIRPVPFKKYFSDFLFPFSYWYLQRFDSYINLIKTEKTISPVLTLLTLPGLTYIWNHRNKETEAIYDALPPFYKYGSISLVLGIDKEKNTPIILRIVHPIQTIADFVGWNNFYTTFDDFINKRIDATTAFKKLIFGTPTVALGKIATLANPAIQGMNALLNNRDLFTGREIVPQELKGTSYENEIKMRYFAQSLFLSPIIPMINSAGYEDMIDILQEYGFKNPEGYVRMFQELISGYLKEAFYIKSALFSERYEEPGAFIFSAIYRESRERTEAENEIFERIAKALEREDFETVRNIIKEAQENKNYPTTPTRIVAFLERPSTQLRYLEAKAKKIKDKELREQFLEKIKEIRLKDFLLRRTEKEKRNFLLERFNNLYEIFNDEELK